MIPKNEILELSSYYALQPTTIQKEIGDFDLPIASSALDKYAPRNDSFEKGGLPAQADDIIFFGNGSTSFTFLSSFEKPPISIESNH